MKLLALLTIGILVSSCGCPKKGKNGAPGLDGNNGRDGYSLVVDVVTQTSGNVQCKRTDIFQDLDRNNYYSTGDLYQNGFLVCDGEAGVNGVDGQDGLNADLTYQVVEIIDPCGAQHPNGYDEVILKLGSGQYLASFSDNANGKNTRFGLLPSGNYQTTDGTGCNFTI
jgi:hypothetical protein